VVLGRMNEMDDVLGWDGGEAHLCLSGWLGGGESRMGYGTVL